MSSSDSLVKDYVSEFGYKPESLQKLMSYAKENGLSMKYSQVKKAFDTMKKDKIETPDRDIIKSDPTNLDVNTSKIDIDLMPTPEAEQAKQSKEEKQNTEKPEQKQWTFDVVKATEAIQIFERLNKKITITADILPQILEWANNNENKYGVNGITLNELKHAYSQKKAFEAMDLPSNKKNKRKKAKSKKPKKETEENKQLSVEIIELKSMIDYCSTDIIKDILQMYISQWGHQPLNAKQLLNFIDEQKLTEKDDKYKQLSFEMLSKYFEEYEAYKKETDIKNAKIEKHKNKNKKALSEFNCNEILNKYISTHGQPKDSTMFWKYVLDLGFDVEFKQLDEEYNKAQGIKKQKKKKVKISRTSKKLKNLYKKSKR